MWVIILLYMGIMLIIYRLHILPILPLTAALIIHPILLFILPVLPILPPLFSLPSFCLISKELIFLPFIFYCLLYLPIGILVVIPHLPVFFLGILLLTFIIVVIIFQNNNLLDNVGDIFNLYLNFILRKGFLFFLLISGERCGSFFKTFISAFALEIPLYRFNNIKIRKNT